MRTCKNFLRTIATLLCIAQINSGLAHAAPDNKNKPSTDIQQRIQSAKTIYLVDGGADTIYADRMPGGAEGAYKQLRASLSLWGHFRLAATVTDADLVFDIHSYERESCSDSTDDNGNTTTSCSENFFYILTIKDPATLDALWTITAPADADFNHKNGVPGISWSITGLTSRIKVLSGETLSKTETQSLRTPHHWLGPLLIVGGLGAAAGTVFAVRQLSANKHCHPGVPCDVFN